MLRSSIYCFLLILIAIPRLVKAQSDTDTLQQKSYNELRSIFFKNRTTDTVKAKKIAKIYLDRAKKSKDSLIIARSFYLYYSMKYDSSTIHYLDSVIAVTKNKQDKDFPAYAYFAKARYFLYQKRNIEKTLDNLYEASKFSEINNNIDLQYRIEYFIGIVRSEHLGEKEKAIQVFKKCVNFYKGKSERDYPARYLYTLHVIAETHIGLKKNDSATYYNVLGYTKAMESKNDTTLNKMSAYFTLCEGINQFERKKYIATIDSIYMAIPTMIELNDVSNTLDSYFYLGKSYYALDQKEKAIGYFLKTDSILETLNSIPQYKHVKTYEYLKEYYKDKNDLQNQNKYLDKLNKVLDNYLNDRIFISKKVREDYDIPLLIEEQQELIEKLNKSKSTYISSIWILALLLLISGGLLYYQYRKKRLYRLRFEKLMEDLHSKPAKVADTTSQFKTENKTLNVPKKHVDFILEKLQEFEEQHGYLTMGISSQSLADEMETNIKYLSKVINHYKHKTFTHYLNDLRIQYAIKELQQNNMLRKFTIKAIANEFGYNSAETFSNAFYKKVKIKPSYFIKELGKVESNV